MKVLSVLPTPNALAGTEMTTHAGNRALIELGHQVHLLHGETQPPSNDVPYSTALGLPVLFDHHSKLRPKGTRAALRALERYVADHRVDVVHVSIAPRMEVLRWLVDRFAVVITTHVPVCPNGTRYRWRQRRACDWPIGLGCFTVGWRRCGCGTLGNERPIGALAFLRMMAGDAMYRDALHRCAAVITPSDWMRTRLVADGVPSHKIRTIPPPIEAPRDRQPSRLNVQAKRPVVLFVGRLVDFKGPDLVLRAVAELHENVDVWLVGDGPMRPRLERLALDLGMASRVSFLGALDQAQVSECYRRASACVVPSLCPETFGRVAAEACLHGVPVIASRVGGLPEAVRGCPASQLVEPGNVSEISQALKECLRVVSLPAGSPWPSEHGSFSRDAHVRLLLEVYQEAVARRDATMTSRFSRR